jgi:hypothetical protein
LIWNSNLEHNATAKSHIYGSLFLVIALMLFKPTLPAKPHSTSRHSAGFLFLYVTGSRHIISTLQQYSSKGRWNAHGIGASRNLEIIGRRRSARCGAIAKIPPGDTFAVIDGPVCQHKIRWWKVNYNGVFGWTGEAQGHSYWSVPLTK